MRKVFLAMFVVLLGTASSVHARNDSVSAARTVMDAFMTTFNARDEAAWADTGVHGRIVPRPPLSDESEILGRAP